MNLLRHLSFRLLALGLTLASVAGAQSNMDASPSAKEHFAAGVAHVQDPSGPKYEEAYREFKAAYADTPLHTIALNIGYCAFFLERDQESLEMYELYLSKVGTTGIPKAQREQLERDVRALKAGLVRLSVKVTPVKAMLVDERIPTKGSVVVNRYPIENGVAQLGIHPGSHRVTLVAEGYKSQSWEFEAQPASSHNHEFKLLPTDAAKPVEPNAIRATQPPGASQSARPQGEGLPTSVYVGGAVTGVFVVGATVTGILAISKKGDYDDRNRDGLQPQAAQSLRDEAKRYALVTDIGLGAALLAAGITTYLYVSESQHSSKSSTPPTGLRLSPSLGANQGGLTVSGQF